jgi:transcriptional regulator with XRE-family HTH domain
MRAQSRARTKRKRPARLAEKLLEIRRRLGLSQDGMIRRMGLEDELERDYISKFERGVLEPTLEVLLEYARAVSATGGGEYLEALIDDSMDLPKEMPSAPTRGGRKREPGRK